MRYTFEPFWERRPGDLEPLGVTLSLSFETADAARAAYMRVLDRPDSPVHSVRITSEDGSICERWFKLDSTWQRKDHWGGKNRRRTWPTTFTFADAVGPPPNLTDIDP